VTGKLHDVASLRCEYRRDQHVVQGYTPNSLLADIDMLITFSQLYSPLGE